MDEQPRGSEMPRSGIRKFINDPKSSVMSYLAENMAAQHLQQQMQQQNQTTSGPPQTNSSYGQHYGSQSSNGLSSQFQSNGNASQTSLAQSQTGLSEAVLQASAPQNNNLQPNQKTQVPFTTPYTASDLASNDSQPSEAYPEPQPGLFQPQRQNPQAQQVSQIKGSEISMTSLGKAPPTSVMKHSMSPQSAPRLYHRMVLDFEVAKSIFLTARAQKNPQEMTSAAYDLESLSRRIWSLRFEHAWEFSGFQESGHQAVIAGWQAQYEFWADTVLDIQEGDSPASMFSALRNSSGGEPITNAALSTNTSPPTSGVGATGPYSQSPQPEFSGGFSHLQAKQPQESLQHLDHQGLSPKPNAPMNPNTQIQPPHSQYTTPMTMPGDYASVGVLPSAGNPSQQPIPLQQQSISSAFQQPEMGQSRPMPGQHGPQSLAQDGENIQSMPPNSRPNIQQGPPQQLPPNSRRNTHQGPPQQFPPQQVPPQQMPPQQMPPQQMPPQQMPPYQMPPQQMPPQQMPAQQMTGGSSNRQSPPYSNQRPPQGPPYTSMPPQGPNQSPRPNSNIPQSLQSGSR